VIPWAHFVAGVASVILAILHGRAHAPGRLIVFGVAAVGDVAATAYAQIIHTRGSGGKYDGFIGAGRSWGDVLGEWFGDEVEIH
jgi:hypothetical protein